ncbi:MAG: hypothetical protein R3A51_02310 [Nannocystaceae bacterium]
MVQARAIHFTVGLVLLCVPACTIDADDPGGGGKREASIAKAFDAQSEQEAAKKAEEERFLAEYAEKKKAEEAAAKAQFDEAVEALAVLPQKPARDVKAACDDAADAYDVMMKRRFAEDAKELRLYYDRRRVERAEIREKCRLAGGVKVGSCYANALWKITPELYAHDNELLRRCVEKFGDGPTAQG